jgi:hypothetical protein
MSKNISKCLTWFKEEKQLIIEYCNLLRNVYWRKRRIHKNREFDQLKINLAYMEEKCYDL